MESKRLSSCRATVALENFSNPVNSYFDIERIKPPRLQW